MNQALIELVRREVRWFVFDQVDFFIVGELGSFEPSP